MLGRLKMDIDRCIDVYTNMMDSIFKKERHRINIKGSFQARFSTEELERAIKKAIVDSGLPVDASMRYRGSDVRECKV
jgi:outer membrane translocation and assembly module TamA